MEYSGIMQEITSEISKGGRVVIIELSSAEMRLHGSGPQTSAE